MVSGLWVHWFGPPMKETFIAIEHALEEAAHHSSQEAKNIHTSGLSPSSYIPSGHLAY